VGSHNTQIHATRRIKDRSHGTERRRCERVIVFSDFDLYVRSVANTVRHICELEMWADAQRDGRPDEYRWRPLFNAAKFG